MALRIQLGLLLVAVCLAPGASGLTRVLIFTGLPGEDSYQAAFAEQAEGLGEALRGTGAEVELYSADEASFQAVRRALVAATSLARDDRLIVIYVGHGSYDGRQFKLNLRGPDVSAAQLGDWLEPIDAAQLVILTSAASGAALRVLEAERRTLMTATRSGDQNNATVFGHYLTLALEDPSGDIDKDRALSLTEVFELAQRSVIDHYENRRLMATEHPQLVNVLPGFTMSHLGTAALDPATAGLRARRADVESAIAALKERKSDLSSERYFQQLQQLLLELAVIEQEIEQQIGIDPSVGEL